MKDSLGAPQSLLVLGGSSDIAMSTARKMAAARTKKIYLAGRPSQRLEDNAAELRTLGATVEVVPFDAAATDDHDKVLSQVFAADDIDVVLMAFGVLGDQAEDEKDPVRAAAVAHVNYTGAVSSGIVVANALKKQGHGSLVVLSSVAAERARKANFIYGSSKAGLDSFAQGLGDSLVGTGVHVMVVRPGFVETKMTHGKEKTPLATTPDAVADLIITGLRRGSHTVWAPGAFRYVMSGLRHVPRPLFRRLPM